MNDRSVTNIRKLELKRINVILLDSPFYLTALFSRKLLNYSILEGLKYRVEVILREKIEEYDEYRENGDSLFDKSIKSPTTIEEFYKWLGY